jgi:predicted ATPase
MEPTTKYVITGGPGTGKSSVLEALHTRGYTTIDEAAMNIKAEQQARKDAGLEYTLPENDNAGFQRLIYTTQVERERNAYGITFVDRGIVDNIGYCRRFETPVCDELAMLCKSVQYARVFLLESLPEHLYRNEQARDESHEESALLGRLLEQAYFDHGYTSVRVPFFDGATKEESVNKRVEYILEQVGL